MSDEKPWDTKIRGMPVCLPDECVLCGDFQFSGWNILHGEANCSCGAVYQLKPTSEESWEDVPRHKIKEDHIEPAREYVEETGHLSGYQEWYEANYNE